MNGSNHIEFKVQTDEEIEYNQNQNQKDGTQLKYRNSKPGAKIQSFRSTEIQQPHLHSTICTPIFFPEMLTGTIQQKGASNKRITC